MNWKQAYQGLRDTLDRMPADAQRLEFLRVVQHWLSENVDLFGENAERYGLGDYASMDLGSYPIESSSLNTAEEIKRDMAVPTSSVTILAQRLRNIFWEGLTIDTGVECPQCSSGSLRVLRSPIGEQPVFACDLCSWAQTVDGAKWEEPPLVPPTRALVDRWRASGVLPTDLAKMQ